MPTCAEQCAAEERAGVAGVPSPSFRVRLPAQLLEKIDRLTSDPGHPYVGRSEAIRARAGVALPTSTNENTPDNRTAVFPAAARRIAQPAQPLPTGRGRRGIGRLATPGTASNELGLAKSLGAGSAGRSASATGSLRSPSGAGLLRRSITGPLARASSCPGGRHSRKASSISRRACSASCS